MKRFLIALFLMVFFAVCAGTGTMLYGLHLYKVRGPLAAQAVLVVESGQGVATIADRLERAGIIENALVFRIATRLDGRHKTLKAGEYEFPPGVSMRDVLDRLASGAVVQRRFTVPEGLTSWQAVQLLNGVEWMEGEITDIPAEGSLLPETYDYRRMEARSAKIAQMQAAMAAAIDEAWTGRAANLPLATKEEAVTLASIVEKETGVASERRRIAGVFVNRLRLGMPLQTDPTVIYALTGGKPEDGGQGPLGRRLLARDLDLDSPYNTYRYLGLPPGPICNPGRAALEAALHPEEHGYLYFVADGSGGHVFATTLEEHNSNVAAWRKIRKNGDR